MTQREQNIESICNACIEANPDGYEFGVPRPKRLADVLLAIDKRDSPPAVTSEGQFFQYDPEMGSIHLSGIWWNLRQDDLTLQSDETLTFIADLIAP